MIWTSDNGPVERPGVAHGNIAPLVGWGYSTGEGGMRMPFVARWPGRIPGGTVSAKAATAMDLLPTLVPLAGDAVPE